MINDHGYIDKAVANIREVAEKQSGNIHKAAELMADAIEADRLINVYAGGGHTTLAMGEMFFRAGGLANVNPLMETALSVFNQALKYLELERTVNFGASIVKYYDIQKDDVVLFFHNIGINPATIDAAMEVKKRGAKLIAIASSYWQNEMPPDHFIRHPNHKNLFDYADVCIDDYNPVGDAIVQVPGLDTPIAPVSNVVAPAARARVTGASTVCIDYYVVHVRLYTNTPLVEGIAPPRRSSMLTASRMARLTALKAASILWWSLRPRIVSMCRLH